MRLSQWADENRILAGPAVSEPGPWRTDRAPYTREPMDCISDPRVDVVALMWGSQLAKTELILNTTGYFIDVDPASIVLAQPNIKMARFFSKRRLDPMLEATASLLAKVAPAKSRDSDNTTLSKVFRGGYVDIATAESASDLSARPARVVIGDEVDRMGDTAEGDPMALLEARCSNFWNAAQLYVSSPRDKGTSRIEAMYEASDRRKWWVPCPCCGAHQVLTWEQVGWERKVDAAGELVRDDFGHVIHLPGTARYFCEHCGEGWSEAQRHEAIRKGEWRAEAPFTGTAGFWLSGLYSPFQSLPKLVGKHLKAKKSPGKYRVFVNTVLAETWEDTGEQVATDDLVRRAEVSGYAPYGKAGALVPRRVVLLILTVDVQVDRLEVAVVGWGRDYQNWLIEHRIIAGDPLEPRVWDDLAVILAGAWQTTDGRELRLRASGVDSGGKKGVTQIVYNFCKRRWSSRTWALKGKSRGVGEQVWPHRISRGGKRRKDPLWVINVDASKAWVAEALKIEEPGPAFCNFPKGVDSAFLGQFRGEKLVKHKTGGRTVEKWEEVKGRRNEALDLYSMNYAVLCGLEAMGLDLNAEADRLAKGPPPEAKPPAPAPPPPPPSGGGLVSTPASAGVTLSSDPYLL